jgi:hypothetical protein
MSSITYDFIIQNLSLEEIEKIKTILSLMNIHNSVDIEEYFTTMKSRFILPEDK